VAKIRVLIADDHGLMREGVKALLTATEDIDVVGEAEDGNEAVSEVRRLDPDVVLMDVAMPGLGGLEATLVIRKEKPDVKILVLTQYDDREYVSRFLKAGASGYVLKKAAAAELVAAIRAVSRGGLVLDPEIAREVLRDQGREPSHDRVEDPYESLTDREKIAVTLGITVKTAMAHREHLMGKLGVHSRTELIRFALRRGVIRV